MHTYKHSKWQRRVQKIQTTSMKNGRAADPVDLSLRMDIILLSLELCEQGVVDPFDLVD